MKTKEDSVAHTFYVEISLFLLDYIRDGESSSSHQIFIFDFYRRARVWSRHLDDRYGATAIFSLHESFARNRETTPRALETRRAAV